MDHSTRYGKDTLFSTASPSVSDHWGKPIALPEEMENFTLCDFIGQGSSGQVYRAVQTKEFAIKSSRGDKRILVKSQNASMKSVSCSHRAMKSFIPLAAMNRIANPIF